MAGRRRFPVEQTIADTVAADLRKLIVLGGCPSALLGALFESITTLSLQVYAARNEAKLRHLRTARGRQEIDLIVERADGSVLAVDVKLARDIDGDDVKHLHWLKDKLGERVLDRIVVTTGPRAYRRTDGVAVVPLALLGP